MVRLNRAGRARRKPRPRPIPAVRRHPRLARDIARVLLVKTILLFVILRILTPGPQATRVDSGSTAQHLLGTARNFPSLKDTHGS
ncbi:hypothetical protein LMG22931_05641 [Paraburkholderia nemoris]|nr:hypothetical protein LMG22931_05641 [Paraburkholderia nemoris]